MDYLKIRRGGGHLNFNKAIDTLSDFEKIITFFDGTLDDKSDVRTILNDIENNVRKDRSYIFDCKKVPFKFFTVDFYKKGTIHIYFTNNDLLDKFNIYVTQNKNWLPPNYGKFYYENMTEEEKEVIDSFQGESKYKNVMNNKSYWLTDISQLMLNSGE